jgi:D-aspartate ligase
MTKPKRAPMDHLPPAHRPAVVLAEHPAGLGAVRSLHAAGIPSVVVALDASSPAMWSRLPVRKVLVPHTMPSREEALLATLEDLSPEAAPHARPVLIPTSDRFLQFVVSARARLERRYAMCVPDDELIRTLIDKARETALLERIRIPLPRTVRDLPSRPDTLIGQLGLPLIIKPRSFAERPLLGSKNIVVEDERALNDCWPRVVSLASGLIAQEVIPGSDDQLWVCNCTFDRTHELIGAFTFQRLRLTPPHYGVTSYARSVYNQAVVDIVERLGRALKYTGPAMVEFKYDQRDGQYKYIELNPRLGMCNVFDTGCGVNNALYTYQLAVGMTPGPRPNRQRTSVMFLSFGADLQSRRKDGESYWMALRDYTSNLTKPHVWAFFSVRDVWPAVRAFGHDIAAGWNARLGRSPQPAPA